LYTSQSREVSDVNMMGWLIGGFFVLAPLVVVASIVLFLVSFARRARAFGYPSMRAYLRAAPRSDPERRDAVDLALKGFVVTGLGILFPPFVLVGLMPLFYGGRKLAYASMGLGLVDDES
jgi:uncharacterized membrane protein